MTEQFRPMPIVEVGRNLFRALEDRHLETPSEFDYDGLSFNQTIELDKANKKTTYGFTNEQLFYYMFTTGNYKKEPIKYYRVILEEDGIGYTYCYVNDNGKINRVNEYESICLLTAEQVPEKFKPFMVEAEK